MVVPSELWEVGFQRLDQGLVKMGYARALSAAQKQLAISSSEGRSADTRCKRGVTIGVTDVYATLRRTDSSPVAICQFEVRPVLLKVLPKGLEFLLAPLPISLNGNASCRLYWRGGHVQLAINPDYTLTPKKAKVKAQACANA